MSSTKKSVLPPSRARRSSPEATVHLLQKKLDVAEKETVSLVSQLASLGFNAPDHANGVGDEQRMMKSPEPIQPFLPRSVESEVLHRNYQTLVSRLCRNESQIQTLRLNLCSLQAAKGLKPSEVGTLKDQVVQLTDAHSSDIKRLQVDLEKSKKELKEAGVARTTAEQEARRLRVALDEATATKDIAASGLAVGYEDVRLAKQKLSRRVNELREELGREVSLRSSLEDSHATLLQRIVEMEAMVESERREVQSMNENCIELRHEGARILEEKKQESARRKALEEAVTTFKADLESRGGKLSELLEQNQNLASALAASKKTCNELHMEVEKQAKLVLDTQTLLVQVQSERESLQEVIQKANPKLFEEKQQSIIAEYETKLTYLEKQRSEAESKLGQARQERHSVQSSSSKLEEQLIAVKLRLSDQESKQQSEVASLEHAITQLKDELQQAIQDKEAVLRSKETLLDEVNQAVDGMAEERRSVQEKISQAQAEVSSLNRQRDVTEQENSQLRERIAILERQQTAHQKVESTISDLLESKNRLAYEKGQLQNRVDQLQRDLQSLENIQKDALKQKRAKSELETKFKETKRELSENRQTLQHMENVFKQEQANSGRKEEDFSLAIQARDEALRDAERLSSELEALRLREKRKTSSLQKSLSEARSDHGNMATTLESVMTSHGQLQVAVETLQTELGQKDHELSALRQERQSHKRSMEQMQREVKRLQEQIAAMETADSNQLSNMNTELAQAAQSQSKMAARLQEALAMVTKLQVVTEGLQGELDKKEAQYHILSDTRQHEKEESVRIRAELEEKVESLRHQLRSSREGAQKKLHKELSELRQARADSNSNAEKLTKENRELQMRLEEAEQKISKLKIRFGSQKTQLAQFRNTQRTNRDLESRLQEIQDRLKDMEKTKADYAVKNRDQARTIASFMGQMAELQTELVGLTEMQKEESDHSRDKVHRLEKDLVRKSQLQKENARLKKQLREMEEKKNTAEERLVEASNESLEISNHLHEAHDWFKSRYSGLQRALSEMKTRQTHLEETSEKQQKELFQERLRSEAQTKKAQEMIKASRQALNHLANQAEVDQLETRTQMHSLARRVQAERDHADFTDRKMDKLLNTSAELVEELALELDRSYSNTRP